ncbi:hypothetical protein [Geomonas subterranea]|uniref:hypothetical protein n=1 Tax=Geomonas subterranea TaxID=2847989 RepID=UPI001CD3554C|nr:hypothetical protein [Geomonas fuzhouensis]
MLEICAQFFHHLNSSGVLYCHWKSNRNLEMSLAGKTDLDLLVDPASRQLFEQSLAFFGMKRLDAPPGKAFPGLEDYLGFDYATGALIHLHVHYALVMGEKFIKNHRLPLERLFFNHLVLSPQGIWIPCPELELIVLVLRAHMKTDLASLVKLRIKESLGEPYNPFPDHILQELLELTGNSDLEKARDIYRESDLPLAPELIFDFIRDVRGGTLRAGALLRGKARILFGLRGYARENIPASYVKYAVQYLRRLPLMPRYSPKKTVSGGGRVFALVGADGAGKSSLVQDLDRWLSWKVQTRRVYLGIPKDGVVHAGFALARRLAGLGLRPWAGALEALLWLVVARRRRAVSLRASRLAAAGEIVLSDRFPMEEFNCMPLPMDGPRLGNSGSRFADLEASLYRQLARPDRILVLKADLEALRKRKADLPLEAHLQKVRAVNAIAEKGDTLAVDAMRGYQEVLLDVKRLVWRALSGDDATAAYLNAPSSVPTVRGEAAGIASAPC